MIQNSVLVQLADFAVEGEGSAFAVVGNVPALAEPEACAPGSNSCVGVSVVVVCVVSNDLQGQGVLVNDADTADEVNFTILVSFAAHDHGRGSGGDTQSGSCGRAAQQGTDGVILSGDGLTVVEGQAFLDLDGVGSAAVFIVDALPAFHNGSVVHVLTKLVGDHGAVVVQQVGNQHVGSTVLNQATGEVTGDVGGRTVDQLVFTGNGFSCGGSCLSSSLSCCRGGAVATGDHGQNHCQGQQQCEKLFH